MSISTFSGLFIARRGVQASRAALQITGQNMTNVNTEGYTKQTVDIYSLESAQGNMRIAGPGLQVGEGVDCARASQTRDPFLDIRYREKNREAGGADAQYEVLNDVQNTIDENINKGISTQLSDFMSQLAIKDNPESSIRSSAQNLVAALNGAATKLAKARSDAEGSLNNAVTTVNGLLNSIASYNDEIRGAELSGSSALEIKDKLNTAIDSLSKYMNINVSYSTESAGVTTVSKLTINLMNDDGGSQVLVDGGDFNQLVAAKNNATGEYTISVASPMTANNLLKRVSSLNQEIQSTLAANGSATDLINERNACLTDLNNYIHVSFNTNFTKNSNPSDYNVSLTNSNPPASLITNTINGTQFDTVCNQLATDIDSNTGVTSHLYIVDPQNNRPEVVADTSNISYTQITSGTIGGYRTMLNDEGEFDGTSVRGIGYYENVLDTFANQFASIMNQQNSTDGANKPLFASSDLNNTTISASNIAISKQWADSISGWLTTTKTSSTTGTNSPSSDGLNLISMVSALSQNINFTTANGNAPTGKALFSASINTFMSTVTNTVLAPQLNNVTREKDVADSELANTDSERASVSSVDINEEGINMIRYNQAFSASSRFMSTINDMLDTLINKMGIS